MGHRGDHRTHLSGIDCSGSLKANCCALLAFIFGAGGQALHQLFPTVPGRRRCVRARLGGPGGGVGIHRSTQIRLTEIGAVDAILLELDDFDLNARAVIMKMQPREREDLIQGLKEDGPEGYRHFIRDYFRKLTKVQAEK